MIVKDKFSLTKGVPNVLHLSEAEIKRHTVSNGIRNLTFVLQLFRNRINHFTKDYVFDILSSKEKSIAVVNLPNYNLFVSYNIPTNQIVVNISPFGGVDNIYPNDPDPKNVYAVMVYAICFHDVVTGKYRINESYVSTIVNYFLTMFIRLFGKEYGLLGVYSNEIVKLKFLISCYVLTSFFGVTGNEAYRKSSIIAPIDYHDFHNELIHYDFSNIEDFIKSLSELRVLPGINKYSFTSRIMRMLSLNFLPAFEDLSRFISIITTSSITGSNIVPTFISTSYNVDEYKKLIDIAKLIFNSK